MPRSKAKMIYDWKRSGLIYDNYDELYDVYINTMECQHCQTEFTKKKLSMYGSQPRNRIV